MPCIAHITLDNTYHHYVVIYEINFHKKQLLIADPANNIKKISFNDFNKIWNKILIILYPIQKIPTYKPNLSLYEFITNTILINRKEIKTIVILSIIIAIFSIATSFFLKYIIDSINIAHSNNHLFFIFVIFFSLYLLKIISCFFRNKLLIYINQKIDLMLNQNAFKQIISLPYQYYCNRTTGEIIERINDLRIIRDMISKVAFSIFIDLPISLCAFIGLYFINNNLFFIALIILIFCIINLLIFKPLLYKNINQCQEDKSKVTSYMIESISGFETVKGLGIEPTIIDNFERKQVQLLNRLFKLEDNYNIQLLIKDFINNIGFIVIIYVGGILVLKNTLTISSLLTFNALLNYFLEPIQNITNLDMSIKESKSALKRILELFYSYEEKGIINQEIKGNIEIKNLNYTYNDQNYVLKNVNLVIKEGEKVIITGHSGSGKSTLLKILKGYYQIDRNKVIINGIDINDYKKECFNNKLTYISQKELLFTDSLYNNLNLTNSDNDFLEVVKMCYVDQIIKNNNLGFNMLIEENGFNLSGGERQRIILARTLLKPFNILLIDEGLNQVDLNLERKILKNIFKYYQKETILIVSHRLSNLDLFDKLIEFKDGCIKRIVEYNE